MHGNKKNLHVHLFIVGVVAVLLILLISTLQAKNNNFASLISKREGCIKSLERSCYQRTTPAGNILLDSKGGERAYRQCFLSHKIPGTVEYDVHYGEADTEYCTDFGDDYIEVFQYCIEGKDQYISEFFGQCRRKPLGNVGDSCSSVLDCHVEYFCNSATGLCDDPGKYPDGISDYVTSSPCESKNDCKTGQSCDAQGFCVWNSCKSDSDCSARGLTNYYCDVSRGQCIMKNTTGELGSIGDKCTTAFECQPEYFCNLAAGFCDDPNKYGYGTGGFGNSTACRSNGDCRSTEYCELPAGFCARGGCRSDSDCIAQGLTDNYCDLSQWRCAP